MNKIRCLWLAGVVFWSLSVSAAPWRVGIAVKDITPTKPVWMCGHTARNHPAEGTIHPLRAKALVIEDPRGNRAVIVTTDLIGFPGDVSEAIAGRLKQWIGIERERIVFSSSHTHCGPLLSSFAPGAFPLEKEFQAAVDSYTRDLEDKVTEVVVEATGKMRPARLAYSEDQATFGANRRRIRDGRYTSMGVNLDGLADHLVPVLSIRDENDRLLAVLFGYACHNTTLGAAVYKYNGDYAGFAQIALEKAHPQAAAMFMIGCGADANPISWNGSQPEKAEEYGKQLAAAVDRALAKKPLPLSGPLAVAFQRVDLPFANPMTREQIENRRGKGNRHEQAEAEFLLQHTAKHGFAPRAYPCPVQVVQFGRDISLVALSGETCVGYALRLREELKGQRIWVAGYCNDVFAYVPTEQILKEGGYEAGASYGLPSQFQAGIEDRIITLAKKLVAQCVQAAQ